MDLIEICIEICVAYILLLILTRLLGKGVMAQLTPFDFISALLVSEIAGNVIFEKDLGIGALVVALLVWACLTYLSEKLPNKCKAMTGPMEGHHEIVIHNGMINVGVLEKNKMDMNEMLSFLRKQGVFDIQEVKYAILEKDGTISVMKMPESEPPQRKDLKLDVAKDLPVSLKLDGNIEEEKLMKLGKDRAWLEECVFQKYKRKLSEAFYVEWNPADGTVNCLFMLDPSAIDQGEFASH